MKQVESIVIKIEDSLDVSKSFELKNLLQTKAIEKIKKLVGSRLEKLNSNCNNRKHDTITILGERGSGKTSLLLNLETILENNKLELEFLDVIDPTLFETKQNILVSIISLIADRVKDKGTDEWAQSLVELGEGLKLLDGVGSNILNSDLFDDGALILEKGLNHASSGFNLEKSLNIFITKSLDLLDYKKMFVLVFDDIDTNIDKGWMVLETIRKYLTSCKLQVFVSGDWELYSSLVRMKQWENFDKKVLPEKEWKNKKDLVDVLEEQYLIKVLKPEYRIYLENFYSLSKTSKKILVEGFGELNVNIERIYQYLCEILFNIQNLTQQKELLDLFKKLPIRTNMKIFYAHLLNKDNSNELINEISNVFITNTSKYNFTHLEYENLSTSSVIQEMAKKLYLLSDEQFSFEKLSQFPMNVSDKNLNLFLMVINLHLTHTLNSNLYTFFEWLTRFTYLDVLSRNLDKDEGRSQVLEALKYNHIISMSEQIHLLGREYERIMKQAKIPLLGFRTTYAFDRFAKKAGFLGVDKFENDVNLDEKFLINIIANKTGKVAHSEQTSVSLINIFGFLAEFLKQDINNVEEYLYNLFEEVQDKNYENNTLMSGQFEEDDRKEILNSPMFNALLEWHKLSTSVEMFSVSQVNKIWNEFINRHDSLQEKKFDNLKDFLSSQIIIFLNLVITEVLFHNEEKKIYSSINTITNLYRNIKTAYGNKYEDSFYDKVDLFKFMYMCPILYCFVEDASFVEPQKEYWIGKRMKDGIKTSFGKLAIQGGKNQEDKKDSINDESYSIIEKHINKSDLRKITDKDPTSIIEIIDQIKSGEIRNVNQLWNQIRPTKSRMTPERQAILVRFISNIKYDTEENDSSIN